MLIAQLQTLFAHACEVSSGKFSQNHCLWVRMCIESSLFLPYGGTSCDYIGDVTMLTLFNDPSSGESYQAEQSLSFCV